MPKATNHNIFFYFFTAVPKKSLLISIWRRFMSFLFNFWRACRFFRCGHFQSKKMLILFYYFTYLQATNFFLFTHSFPAPKKYKKTFSADRVLMLSSISFIFFSSFGGFFLRQSILIFLFYFTFRGITKIIIFVFSFFHNFEFLRWFH